MLRLVPFALLLLLAGCAGPASLAPDDHSSVAPAAAEETWVVTATRVEPTLHQLRWAGEVAARPCASDGSETCRGPVLYQSSQPGFAVGVTWDEPARPFHDTSALFWRLGLEMSWRSQNPTAPALELQVRTLMDCLDCDDRLVETFRGASPLSIHNVDVFLQPHEVGLLLIVRAVPDAMMESAWGEAAVEFQVEGVVAGYHAVDEPVLLAS